jgi:hypothetical protein
MAYSVEGRRRVKEQMNKRKADDEFGLINLSYFDHQNQEITVFCPESKDAEAAQNPQRKSLPGVVRRRQDSERPPSATGVEATLAHSTIDASLEPEVNKAREMTISEIIVSGESSVVEFKSSLRMNLHTKNADQKIEHAVLKTLAAFLNTRGGTLVIGVDDNGTPLGLEDDGFQSEDKMDQHLANLSRTALVHNTLYACTHGSWSTKESAFCWCVVIPRDRRPISRTGRLNISTSEQAAQQRS